MKKYEINEHGVVLNPDTVFYYMPKNALAWLYWEISVGICNNNLWDFSLSYAGGGSPCSLGRWKTKEDAIKNAINNLKVHFKHYRGKYMYKEKDFITAKKNFFYFQNNFYLSKEPQTEHLISVLDTGTNYVQGSLF
jgi:hypothetical protein